MTEARATFGSLVRRTAHGRERIAVTDHGHGSADPRRMHIGRYRVSHEISDTTITITVIDCGRVG